MPIAAMNYAFAVAHVRI